MRFKFCGGYGCPGLVLEGDRRGYVRRRGGEKEELFFPSHAVCFAFAVSQLSAVRFKLIVIVVYRHLLGAPLDYDKLDRYLTVGGEERSAACLV